MKAIAEKYRFARALTLILALACVFCAAPTLAESAAAAPSGPIHQTTARQDDFRIETWTDESGTLATNAMGYCYAEATLNGRSKATETNYYDTAHNLVNCIYGYSTLRAAYDGLGNQTEIAYFNAKGNPVNCQYGYARRVNGYQTAEGKRKLSSVEYFDRYGDPVVVPGRYAKMVNTYSEPKLRLLSTAYYGTDGQPMRCADGYARVEYERSRNARVEAERYYDVDGSLMIAPTLGYAVKLQTYDANDKITSVTYLDETGALTMGPDGYAYAEFDWSRRKECLEERYYGADGSPSFWPTGTPWSSASTAPPAKSCCGRPILTGRATPSFITHWAITSCTTPIRTSCTRFPNGGTARTETSFSRRTVRHARQAHVRRHDGSGDLLRRGGEGLHP